MVGWSLGIGFSCGTSNNVAWGGKIYKCSNDGQGSGAMVKGEHYTFSLYKSSSNGVGLGS